jgi:DNA-3-methyladenine glycosylase I
VKRCWWPGEDPLYIRYHDEEWGRPVSDDRRLFEKICLEGFQAGLSWLTILRKRENFREAFDGFDPAAVARFSSRDVTRLLKNEGIIRHRGKIESTINNARRALALADEHGSLAAYFWKWEPVLKDRPKKVTREALMKMSQTPASMALSKDLKQRGWTFVGPTTVYAFMQAMGLVNDHLHDCTVRVAVERARGQFRRP